MSRLSMAIVATFFVVHAFVKWWTWPSATDAATSPRDMSFQGSFHFGAGP